MEDEKLINMVGELNVKKKINYMLGIKEDE